MKKIKVNMHAGNLIKIGLATTFGVALAYGYHSLAQSSYFSYWEQIIIIS